MSNKQFIEEVARLVKKYAPAYGIKVYSPIIAQAVLESAYGTSELAVEAQNYFGLKYREGRCKTCIGIYDKIGSEQNDDGTYESSDMKWCKFKNLEDCVIGYFDFTNVSNYSNLKGVTDPKTYLENIKKDKYATSKDYVKNLMNTIRSNNLTKYDKEEIVMKFTNSPLVSHTKISPNRTSPRNHEIDTITIHCVVGQLSVEAIGNIFAPSSRQASSNYGIGADGRIGMYVEEKDRSWCSSNAANDNRAVTIEVACDATHPYAVNDKAYAALIQLVADICKRNDIKELKWKGDKSLIGQVSKQNMTVHRWFANKACPGEFLYQRHDDIAAAVNKILSGGSTPAPAPKPDKAVMYRVRKTWADAKSQKGAFKELDNAKACADKNPGYSVFDEAGKVVYTAEAPAFEPYLVKVSITDLYIRKGPGTNYGKVKFIEPGVYTIIEEKTGRGAKKWGRLKSKEGWIALDYTEEV